MSRNEKINKLGRAIREYRGIYNPKTGVWKYPPKPKAAARVVRWLEELTADVPKAMADVDGFKTIEEFNLWIGSL